MSSTDVCNLALCCQVHLSNVTTRLPNEAQSISLALHQRFIMQQAQLRPLCLCLCLCLCSCAEGCCCMRELKWSMASYHRGLWSKSHMACVGHTDGRVVNVQKQYLGAIGSRDRVNIVREQIVTHACPDNFHQPKQMKKKVRHKTHHILQVPIDFGMLDQRATVVTFAASGCVLTRPSKPYLLQKLTSKSATSSGRDNSCSSPA